MNSASTRWKDEVRRTTLDVFLNSNFGDADILRLADIVAPDASMLQAYHVNIGKWAIPEHYRVEMMPPTFGWRAPERLAYERPSAELPGIVMLRVYPTKYGTSVGFGTKMRFREVLKDERVRVTKYDVEAVGSRTGYARLRGMACDEFPPEGVSPTDYLDYFNSDQMGKVVTRINLMNDILERVKAKPR